MTTLYYSHPDFLKHDTGRSHPESAARLTHIQQALNTERFEKLVRITAPLRSDVQELVKLVHKPELIAKVLQPVEKELQVYLDGDTILSSGSAHAALLAVSANCDAVDKVCKQQANNAFCAVRPPGHHAAPDQAMGFCLFNNIAIAAEYARQAYQIDKVAIVDFDVHHGNGTQAAFEHNPNVFYASSHQMPLYPGTGNPQDKGVDNILNIPLHAGETGEAVRRKYQKFIFPVLNAFKPDLLLISAGFDVHKDDPLGSVQLIEDDYQWLTENLLTIAKQHCAGRVISSLEGGYHLTALANSVAVHIAALLNA